MPISMTFSALSGVAEAWRGLEILRDMSKAVEGCAH